MPEKPEVAYEEDLIVICEHMRAYDMLDNLPTTANFECKDAGKPEVDYGEDLIVSMLNMRVCDKSTIHREQFGTGDNLARAICSDCYKVLSSLGKKRSGRCLWNQKISYHNVVGRLLHRC